MAKTREIRKRIRAVRNIGRITRTMQMIATSRFAKAQQRALAGKPYATGIFELVGELATRAGDVSHPMLAERPVRHAPPLTLIVTSDRGLCGPYNTSVLRAAMAHLRALPPAAPRLIELVGRKGAAFLRFHGVPVAAMHHLGDRPTFEAVERLAERYMARFLAGEMSSVDVVYMRYISAGRQTPDVLPLLPLRPGRRQDDADARRGPVAAWLFSPPPEHLLDDLLVAAVKALLFQAINDAIVSEHVARMVAMKAATDNAGKMRRTLVRAYNRARQTQITTELTEIVSGAAALS